MRKKSERIHNESTADQCESRVKEIEEIVDSFRSTLPHPHDFSPSTTDICWIPKMRKALINGTDQEFQNRKANIQATISELSATLLEERREFFLRLLPQDSPTIEHLSLATTLFDCTACHKYGVRIESALRHRCCYGYNHGWYSEKQFPNAMVAEVFRSEVGPSWSLAKFRYSTELAAIVREVVLECGEDPDIITTREMNRKGHRFACFGTDGKITVFSWLQAVSPRVYPRKEPTRRSRHTISSSTRSHNTTHIYRTGPFVLMNYRNTCLNQRINVTGVASTAGEQGLGNPNGSAGISVTSGSISHFRTFFLTSEHMVCAEQRSDIISPGTKLRTRPRRITTLIRNQTTLPPFDINQQRVSNLWFASAAESFAGRQGRVAESVLP